MIERDQEAGPMEGDLEWYLGGDDYNNSWDLDAVVRLSGAVPRRPVRRTAAGRAVRCPTV
jgi:hypothetical protein